MKFDKHDFSPDVINTLYEALQNAQTNSRQSPPVNYDTKHIRTRNDIPFSSHFPSSSLEPRIVSHIYAFSRFITVVETMVDMHSRLKIVFVVEKEMRPKLLERRIAHIRFLYLFLQSFIKKVFPSTFTVYLYLTSLPKELVVGANTVLGANEINTGMTIVDHNEIVIYREEEWYKVLIHESFHALGIDFARLDTKQTGGQNMIKSMFYVNSTILLSEAYTEFWANLLNLLFVSFFDTVTKKEFTQRFKVSLKEEKKFKLLQLVKVLDYMGMEYSEFFSNPHNRFSEDTNVFAYYVLGGILVFYAEAFMFFCRLKNTHSLLQSNHSVAYITEFCKFIQLHYRSVPLLNGIALSTTTLRTYKASPKRYGRNLCNLRMTSTELSFI